MVMEIITVRDVTVVGDINLVRDSTLVVHTTVVKDIYLKDLIKPLITTAVY